MSRRSSLIAGLGILVVLVLFGGALAWSMSSDGRGRTVPTSAPGVSTPTLQHAEPGSARCIAITAAYSKEARARGLTLEAIIRSNPSSDQLQGLGSALAFYGLQNKVDYGAWTAAITYFTATARAQVLHEGEQPRLTERAVRAAALIDRDLAAGVCGKLP